MRFHREFHRQLLQHFLAEAVDDQRHRLFRAKAARLAIEKLVFGDFRRGGFVLDLGAGIAAFDIGHGMGAAFAAHQQGIALGKVASTAGAEQVTRMITMAQEFVDQTQREAETRARELTLAAQEKAREIVSEAQNRAQDEVTRLNGLKQRLSEDVEKLARQVDIERNRLRTQLQEFLQWVEDNVKPASALSAPEAPSLASAPAEVLRLETPQVEPPRPVTPPPAAPPAATIGQVLHFDNDERP